MSKELVISSNRHETKVAIMEDDSLVEIYFQRSHEYSLAGSIHKGRVTRVLPGMQSAFVDLGLERDTFLYVSDFFEENDDFDKVTDMRPLAKPDFARRDARSALPPRPAIPPPAMQPVAPPDPEVAATPILNNEPRGPIAPDRGGDRTGDRGRGRGRRRRGRGRGFPDSKYATETSGAAEEPEPFDGAELRAPADMILLPGESLAKYRHAPAGTDPVEEVSEEELIAEDAFEEEAFGKDVEVSAMDEQPVARPVTEEAGAPSEPMTMAGFPETAIYVPPVAVPLVDSVAEPEPQQDDEPAVDEKLEGISLEDALDRAEEFTGSSDVHTIEDLLAETEVEDDDAASDDTEDPVDGETGELSDEVLSASDDEGEVPAGDDEKPASETVREQGGSRFVQRGGRGRRRRRGGRDRNDRPEREAAPATAETVAAPVREERAPRERGERTERGDRPERPERGDRPPLPSIADLLKEGQEIIVQIAKEPLGQKGARITSHIALPGRYVVYMPSLEHLGVSRKIESDEERHRLKRVLMNVHVGLPGGFIVRTAGEGRTEEEIAADMQFLYNLWLDIRQKAEKRPAPLLLHHDLDIVQRTLRDQMADDFKAVWCDNEDLYESVLRFMQRFQPAMVSRVKLYTRPAHIFDAFNITQELEKALRPKVWLKSGGYIVINQTEALVAIDINTGKYVGKSNRLEDTIVKTNVEAVKEIVRQIRLRDLGGIIVVDFIDMDERKNRQKVMQALEEAMRADRAPYKILQFNDFGLVAITRKRVKQSLERTLCAPCLMCEGAGYVKSVQTVVGEILQEAHKIAKVVEGKDVMLRAHPEVTKFLKSASNAYLEELEEILKRPVLVKSDPMLHPEKFDLA